MSTGLVFGGQVKSIVSEDYSDRLRTLTCLLSQFTNITGTIFIRLRLSPALPLAYVLCDVS